MKKAIAKAKQNYGFSDKVVIPMDWERAAENGGEKELFFEMVHCYQNYLKLTEMADTLQDTELDEEREYLREQAKAWRRQVGVFAERIPDLFKAHGPEEMPEE